jgi:hypothetical protein
MGDQLEIEATEYDLLFQSGNTSVCACHLEMACFLSALKFPSVIQHSGI